jgi:alpha-tubulin suppressor-like RCC1 family protein
VSLLSWGRGASGQLGGGKEERRLYPSPVTHLLSVPVLRGLGSGGGPGEAGSLSVPSKVNALPVPVAAVACGGFFTLALTSDGQLWSWGGEDVAVYYYLRSEI